MKGLKGKLLIGLLLVLSLLIVSGGWAQNVQLPHAQFEGFMATYLNGADYGLDYDLEFLDMYITGITLSAGSQPVSDPIIDAMVQITTKRNPSGVPGTTFDNATITITKGSITFLSATLNNIAFTTDGVQWFLNPGLNVNNPETLNLTNIVLSANGSAYIQNLEAQLGTGNIAGMQMTLDVFDGDISQDSFAYVQGLFDGVPANTPPVANAGEDITIPSSQVASTTVQGTVTDSDDAYTLTCRWTEGAVVLLDWTPVGINGECPLAISATTLGIGAHTLTLEANDGETTSSDDMILTINNSVPNANAGPDVTIISEEFAVTTIQGTTTDFDNADMLYCKWTEGGAVLQDWSLAGAAGECPLPLSGLVLDRGVHTLTLEATDGQATSSDDMVLTINNTPPIANAGENITITSDQITATDIQGTATDFDGDAITCRWTEGATLLQDWTPAGLGGECILSLNSLSFSLGAHTLTFEANDGQAISVNHMILTVNNSAPHAAPGGAGVYEINTPVILPGDASDFDGDLLTYEWYDGATLLCSGDIQSIAGGASVLLPDCIVSSLPLGIHTITLQVSDGINPPDVKSVTVQIVDSSAPTLQPVANKYILWPPNHKMVDIAIAANAVDNSGCPLILNAAVTSNEPQVGLNRGDLGPDWTEPVIDQGTGMIYLQLRAERSGRGKGRKYTVTITATDCAGNVSTAKVKIRVPHDQDNDERKGEDREERDRDDRHDRKDCSDDRDD
ncbi:MAG: hypothetical protein AB1499_02740 [Nitrospirota bacterium]